MPGPPPKLPEERRRRNVPAGGEWRTLPSEPYEGDKPRMPRGLCDQAQRTWKQWWSSPVAHELGANEATWTALERLILLINVYYDKIREGEDPTRILAEIRQQEDRFGLTPKGLQNLRLRLPDGIEDERAAPASESRYAGLRLVEGG